jgi:hypothetical protein
VTVNIKFTDGSKESYWGVEEVRIQDGCFFVFSASTRVRIPMRNVLALEERK